MGKKAIICMRGVQLWIKKIKCTPCQGQFKKRDI